MGKDETKKSGKTLNPKMKEYIIQLATEKLESCELFTRVYGKGFAKKSLRKFIKKVYTDEESEIRSGCYSIKDNSITIYRSGSNGELLKSEDLEEADREVCVHEAVHAVLTRTKFECFIYRIQSGTGIRTTDLSDNEYGRGLNEGLTEWICEKAGFKSIAYPEFVSFIKQLELVLGEEKIMELGKGGISNVSSLLNMKNEDDCLEYLSIADQIYVENDKIKKYTVMKRKVNDGESLSEQQLENITEQVNSITVYPTYQDWISIENRNDSIENKIEFLMMVAKKERNRFIINFEWYTFNKYYIKDFEELYKLSQNNSKISFNIFYKFYKFFELGNNIDYNDYEPAECKKDLQNVKDIFKSIKKEYIEKQFIPQIKDEIKNNQLTIEKIYKYIEVTGTEKIAEIICEEKSRDGKRVPTELLEYLIEDGELDEIDKYEVVELSKTEAAFLKDGKLIDIHYNHTNSFKSSDIKSQYYEVFDVTLSSEAIKRATDNFKKKKDYIKKADKNAVITIANDIIVIESDKIGVIYYKLDSKTGNIYQLKINSQYHLDFSFPREEKQSTNTNLPIPQAKQSIFEKIRAFFSRKQPKMSEGRGLESPNQIPDGLSHVKGHENYNNGGSMTGIQMAHGRGDRPPRGQSR